MLTLEGPVCLPSFSVLIYPFNGRPLVNVHPLTPKFYSAPPLDGSKQQQSPMVRGVANLSTCRVRWQRSFQDSQCRLCALENTASQVITMKTCASLVKHRIDGPYNRICSHTASYDTRSMELPLLPFPATRY